MNLNMYQPRRRRRCLAPTTTTTPMAIVAAAVAAASVYIHIAAAIAYTSHLPLKPVEADASDIAKTEGGDVIVATSEATAGSAGNAIIS